MAEKTTGFINHINPAEAAALEQCIDFLNRIGIRTAKGKLANSNFLSGLSIQQGSIIIDMETLWSPGDILHEAGHIAVIPSAERATLDAASIAKRPNCDAEEMMAIAWSYAACVHLGLDPCFVFHDNGYKSDKGGGSYIADNFSQKKYFGLPMLQWKGMAADEKNAALLNVQPYPAMIKWMLD